MDRLIIDDNDGTLYASVLVFQDGVVTSSIYRSIDEGQSWTRIRHDILNKKDDGN